MLESTNPLENNSLKNITEEFYKKSRKNFEEKIKAYLKDNLRKIGYIFKNDADFTEFVKQYVTRVGYAQRPNYYEFYFNKTSQQEKAILIGRYFETSKITYSGNKVTASIGFLPDRH